MRLRLESHDMREYPALATIPAEDQEAFVTACGIQKARYQQDSCGSVEGHARAFREASSMVEQSGCTPTPTRGCLASSVAESIEPLPQGYTVRDGAERIAVAEEVDRIFAQSYLAAILEEQHGITEYAEAK